MAHRDIPQRLRSAAKRLRRNMTEAENRLWFHLRAHRFAGWGFRRQSPIGPYVADFVSHSARIIIEVDGGQHAGFTTDPKRDAWLRENGYCVLRFWNHDVLARTDSILGAIASELAERSPPSRPLRGRPPPARGEVN